MTARLQRAVFRVTEDKEIMVVDHWSDGTRTTQWLGFWSALRLMWEYARAGVKVEAE